MSLAQVAEEHGAIAFAERLLSLLQETKYTATYKFAVLLGLMDLCLENTTSMGSPPDIITTRQLADKIVEIYWPQTLPFAIEAKATVLLQNNGRQAGIISDIARFRAGLKDSFAPLSKARLMAKATYPRLLNQIEWKLIEMPLPRMQVIGSTVDPFVYEINWNVSVRKGDVLRYQQGHGADFDNRICLKPSVGEHLVKLNGLLRPLIHRRWAGMVAALNHQEDSRLEEFLFGIQRVDLSPLRDHLWEVQKGLCFYCHDRIRDSARSHVDHFIPWARYPDNGIYNLVVADPVCNLHKCDFLPAVEHAQMWSKRFDPGSSIATDLHSIAERTRWDLYPDRTLSVARAIYLRLSSSAKLWRIRKNFEDADRTSILRVFSEL